MTRWSVARCRVIAPILLIGAATVTPGCDGSPTDPPLEHRWYVLVSLDGRPVPAVIDSTATGDGRWVMGRIVGGSIQILTRDTLVFSTAIGGATRLPDGTVETGGYFECSTGTVAYRREGGRLILGMRSPWRSYPPTHEDTLQVDGDRLIQAGPFHDGRHVPLEYAPGEPSVPVCHFPE